jgi:hypothetical protein
VFHHASYHDCKCVTNYIVTSYRLYPGVPYFQNVIRFQGTRVNMILCMPTRKARLLSAGFHYTQSIFIDKSAYLLYRSTPKLVKKYGKYWRKFINTLKKMTVTGPTFTKLACSTTFREELVYQISCKSNQQFSDTR